MSDLLTRRVYNIQIFTNNQSKSDINGTNFWLTYISAPFFVVGIRSPFLQLAGNNTFKVIKDYGLKYDCSWPTITHINPPLWPYTLDFASTQDCPIPSCPSASIPGVWVQPMVSWRDLNDVACSMADGCFTP